LFHWLALSWLEAVLGMSAKPLACLRFGGFQEMWVATKIGNSPSDFWKELWVGPLWVISVDYNAGLNPIKRLLHKPNRLAFALLRERIWQAIKSNPAIRTIEP
jgi:hypothetical protein